MKSIASISILLLTVLIPSVSAEIPNPGAVLLESSTGEVSLSWRALSDVGRYTVMRYDPDQLKHESGFGMKFPEPLSKTTVTGTSFLDPNVPQGKSVLYGVTTEGGTIPLFTAMIQTGAPKPYL
ncbi:MAG: hypothetical protein RBU29_08095, partial [bacterium]|nr:hypothetical protein [bacterium]